MSYINKKHLSTSLYPSTNHQSTTRKLLGTTPPWLTQVLNTVARTILLSINVYLIEKKTTTVIVPEDAHDISDMSATTDSSDSESDGEFSELLEVMWSEVEFWESKKRAAAVRRESLLRYEN